MNKWIIFLAILLGYVMLGTSLSKTTRLRSHGKKSTDGEKPSFRRNDLVNFMSGPIKNHLTHAMDPEEVENHDFTDSYNSDYDDYNNEEDYENSYDSNLDLDWDI